MSVTTSTKPFRDMTRREAIDLCYILEEQRDKALNRRDALAEKVSDAGERIALAIEAEADRPDGKFMSAFEAMMHTAAIARAALIDGIEGA